MRLTNEVKDYIANRVEQLLPQPCQSEALKTLEEEGERVAAELSAKIRALVNETLIEFVEKHPEAEGSSFNYSYRNGYYLCTSESTLQKEVRQAVDARNEFKRTIIVMAHIDAANCTSSVELDEAIVRLVNR